MKKSIVLLLTVLLLAASMFSSCFAEEELPFYASITAEKVSDEPVRLVMLAFDTNPFFNQIKNGFNAVSDYLADKNATVDWISMGDMTSENIIAAIENAISMKYDGIAVISVFDGVETVINKAVDAGIQVVTFVAEGNVPSKRMTSIGQNAKSAGKTAGEAIEAFTGGKGQMAVITGTFGAVQHEDRMNGALDYLKENDPDIEIVGVVENNDSATTAYNQTMDFLTAYPDLKCVYVTAGGPFGACQAIKEMGLTGKVGVVGFDHTPENLEYVYSGEMIAAVSQDPEGQAWNSIMMLYNNIVNGTTYDDHVATPNVVVNPENVVEYYGEAK
ncbi:sugar ABC transporter substrate-binding protein [Flexilinea flocculi]|uniref:ABC-type sugar transport system, periplasmic component, contains N-terminal xre family HTH domain n=1 Tax=Flexilinea flocculi TaxID=1678840 RepID=A0A0S7BM76_9CHLR|nr:sugar ABC transporter substrate-binding protein [Flexilinea flocculi]GAP41466.1 ABC-type sugar transport system, periplasmic component, contains N-terminal xre family HTH domain [Flexilinea flocculi]